MAKTKSTIKFNVNENKFNNVSSGKQLSVVINKSEMDADMFNATKLSKGQATLRMVDKDGNLVPGKTHKIEYRIDSFMSTYVIIRIKK